jgi:hypothetical protein
MTREEQTKLETEKGKMVLARIALIPVFREHIKGSMAPNKHLLALIAKAEEYNG